MEQQRALRLQPPGGELGHQDRAAAEHGDALAVAEQRRRLVGGRRNEHVAQSCARFYDC